MKLTLLGLTAATALLIASPRAAADTILYYDSISGGTVNALDRLDG